MRHLEGPGPSLVRYAEACLKCRRATAGHGGNSATAHPPPPPSAGGGAIQRGLHPLWASQPRFRIVRLRRSADVRGPIVVFDKLMTGSGLTTKGNQLRVGSRGGVVGRVSGGPLAFRSFQREGLKVS